MHSAKRTFTSMKKTIFFLVRSNPDMTEIKGAKSIFCWWHCSINWPPVFNLPLKHCYKKTLKSCSKCITITVTILITITTIHVQSRRSMNRRRPVAIYIVTSVALLGSGYWTFSRVSRVSVRIKFQVGIRVWVSAQLNICPLYNKNYGTQWTP